ncbi:hypothetical protein EIN_359850 [Entamoeba invadens IP1]|uniref:Uncharacterized protein n=1 Tax=Entamoeba invadens IP1 TaxID=370355 RepID=A0A0A1U7R1_ENTIV|nr:hypothetical protein EIN_359850 [Entamoeba invadens IP1]ELP90892.1 hypothetical protein EIN_359850 [Entamoeba invadens IP1]|eukprot:XP_004257663.1 hypothetical protein EIN_359850 [Entamoeba invadens IP1]
MTWFGSLFGKSAPTIHLEETEDKLVYDQTTQRWVKESEQNSPTSTSVPSTSPRPPISPMPVTQPLTVHLHSISARRPRYIDPFTNQVHTSAPPMVEVSATPLI